MTRKNSLSQIIRSVLFWGLLAVLAGFGLFGQVWSPVLHALGLGPERQITLLRGRMEPVSTRSTSTELRVVVQAGAAVAQAVQPGSLISVRLPENPPTIVAG